MASRGGRGLPSDPEFLLELMQELPDESESEDEFDGYLDPEDGPIMLRRSDRDEELDSPLTRARSLDGLNEARGLLDQDVESPLLGSSPSLSPMQVAGGSHSAGATDYCTDQPHPSLSESKYCTVTKNNIIIIILIIIIIILQQPTFSGTPGVIPDMAGKLPIDFFHLMFDDRVLDLLLTETTRYADQYLEREKEHLDQHPQARAHDWQRAPLSLKELEVFLALG